MSSRVATYSCESGAPALPSAVSRPNRAGCRRAAARGARGRGDMGHAVELSDVAFATPEAARQLNALIHPLVLAEEKRMLAAMPAGQDRIVMVEATLLIEAGNLERYDKIIVVDVTPEVQIARGVARGMSREEVARRIAHQLPREERLRHADYVVDNSGDVDHARAEVGRVYAGLRADLEKKKGTG